MFCAQWKLLRSQCSILYLSMGIPSNFHFVLCFLHIGELIASPNFLPKLVEINVILLE